ncbi:MAG: hypothetical protein JWO31_2188 [Phycisphaerales bacterium]|nr:hypothetical protein [Phycisphaerales bacterium]
MTVLLREPPRAESRPAEPSPPADVSPVLVQGGPHRFTLDEYLRLSEAAFLDGRRTELIDGEILDMASQKDPHTIGVTKSL